jgi:hypothetical protein
MDNVKWDISNAEQIPKDLKPGTYCTRLISMTWTKAVVEVQMPIREHVSGSMCCLVPLVKNGRKETADAQEA